MRSGATATATATATTAAKPGATRPRMGALDVLRGIAAFVVLLQHGAEILWPGYFRWSEVVFRPGEWGVFAFFMVSGFVIPLSIEGEKDPASFWIGRFFRLYPLYWVSLAVAVVLWRHGIYPVGGQADESPVSQTLLNITMVQNFLASVNILGSAWSLAYELVFYLFITALLVMGRTGAAVRSTIGALCLACTAGVLIAPVYILHYESIYTSFLVSMGIVAGAVAFAWPHLPTLQAKVVGSVCLGAVVLLVLDQPLDLWFSMLLFATIGCGWVYHEAHRGRVPWWMPFALSGATVLVGALHLRLWVGVHEGTIPGSVVTWHPDALTLGASHLAFAVFYLVRSRTFPAPLRWLGTVSYSVYLVHPVVIHSFKLFDGKPVLTLISWIVVTLVVSAVTYRLVELPGQRAGRALRTRWRQRVAARAPQPAPVSALAP